MDPGRYYLDTYLAPLAPFLDAKDVTDIFVNRPGEVWIDTLAGRSERHDVPALSAPILERLAYQIAALSYQGISREQPLLSASLQNGARVQIVAPPATRAHMAIAIRKQVVADLSLSDVSAGGAFAQLDALRAHASTNGELEALMRERRWEELLRLAVRSRKTILVSGGTATGKTTFLNALLREIPAEERLITIEDTPELNVLHDNAVGLVAARGTLGEANVSVEDLVAASMRMRPDRVIIGEVRGSEAFSFLRAINSGHPGSMSSIHADSPEGAIDQLALLILQGGTQLRREDVHDYVARTVDIYIQLSRMAGRRFVSDIALRLQDSGLSRH